MARRHRRWDDDGVRRRRRPPAAEMDALWALTKRNLSQAARTGVPGRLGGRVVKLALGAPDQSSPTSAMAGCSTWWSSGRDDLGRSVGPTCRGALAQHFVHHRGGHDPDPAQHHRRAHPRSAQGSRDGLRADRGPGREPARGGAAPVRGPVPDRAVRAVEGAGGLDPAAGASSPSSGVLRAAGEPTARARRGRRGVAFEELGRALVPGPLVACSSPAARRPGGWRRGGVERPRSDEVCDARAPRRARRARRRRTGR